MKTAADLKRGHTQWGEDDPLRSARPSEQGRREARAASRARDRPAAADAFSGASLQARKELLYRSYHPQLVSLTAQQRCAAPTFSIPRPALAPLSPRSRPVTRETAAAGSVPPGRAAPVSVYCL